MKKKNESVVHFVFRVLPGLMTWVFLIWVVTYSFIGPVWVALFLIVFDVYWLVKAVHLSFHLISSYKHLARNASIDWMKRVRSLSDLGVALSDTRGEIARLRLVHKKLGVLKFRERYANKQLIKGQVEHVKRLEDAQARLGGALGLEWEDYYQVVVLPTAKEHVDVLRETMDSFRDTPEEVRSRMMFVLAVEDRFPEVAEENGRLLREEYGELFDRFEVIGHPDGIDGEAKVKGANATYALRQVEGMMSDMGVAPERVIVSVFDADTQAPAYYFTSLLYFYLTAEEPTRTSYQPIPMYDNNLMDTPALLRVVSAGTSFWYMIESSRPDRLVTFSSHSMSLRALIDVDFYPVDVVSDDSRIFYRALIHYKGDYRVQPMHVTVSMDALAAPGLWEATKGQYLQIRRWAWGIENVPYVLESFWYLRGMSFWRKVVYSTRLLEANFTWATAALVIAFVGWLPLVFGGDDFEALVISENFLFVAQVLTTLALFGLVTSIAVSLLMAYRRRQQEETKWYVTVLQWFLLPVTTIIFGSLPAIDAQTRMMLGDDLGFNVTEKRRNPRS